MHGNGMQLSQAGCVGVQAALPRTALGYLYV